MTRWPAASLVAATLVLAAHAHPPPAQELAASLAPTGTLRVAINLGNAVLATRDRASGAIQGVTVDLSRELARRLGVQLDFVVYPAAGQVVGDLHKGAWDVAYLAIDPARGQEIAFTAPYLELEGMYLVPAASPLTTTADVDRTGATIVVGRGSAYDLFLTREIRRAAIVRVDTSAEVTDTMLAQRFAVAAGVRQQLEADARRLPALRLLDGRFMVIPQAIATPKTRGPAVSRYLAAFVADLAASGFVAASLERHGIRGVTVTSPGRPDEAARQFNTPIGVAP